MSGDEDTTITMRTADGREATIGGHTMEEALRRLREAGRGSLGERRRAAKAGLGEATMPEGYLLSEEVQAIAERVIESDPRFDVCTGIAMGYALLWDQDPAAKGGLHAIAKAVKAPPMWRDLGQYEVVIFAVEKAWRHLSERQREALLAHELSHVGGRNEAGNVVLLDHDIEEFAWVVGKYGQWHSGLEHFAEQLGLGLAAASAKS